MNKSEIKKRLRMLREAVDRADSTILNVNRTYIDVALLHAQAISEELEQVRADLLKVKASRTTEPN